MGAPVVAPSLGSASAAVEGPGDGVPGQAEADAETIGNFTGGWAALPGGVDARPVVTALSVANGDAVRTVIDNPSGEPVPVATNGLDVVVTPVNLCKPDEVATQPGAPLSPGQRPCYDTPNRVQITIGYLAGQLRTDFSSPAAAPLSITSTSEFDITVNLNSLGRSLRWTWLQGEPTYWRTTNLGQDDATLRVKFRPRPTPVYFEGNQMMGCSAIPVLASCPYPNATGQRLEASLVLSLDETLSAGFTGSLFATENAYMGSLEEASGPNGPEMSWGIAAPDTVDGEPNRARLWAVVPDAALLNYFGISPQVQPGAVLSGEIDAASGTPRLSWTPWTAQVQGTDGWLISTPGLDVDLTSSVQARTDRFVQAQAVGAARLQVDLQRKSRAPVVSATLARGGARVQLTSSAPQLTRACARAGSCRVVVERVVSPLGAQTRDLGTTAAGVVNGQVRATRIVEARSGQRLLVTLQRRDGARWAYLASAVQGVRRG